MGSIHEFPQKKTFLVPKVAGAQLIGDIDRFRARILDELHKKSTNDARRTQLEDANEKLKIFEESAREWSFQEVGGDEMNVLHGLVEEFRAAQERMAVELGL